MRMIPARPPERSTASEVEMFNLLELAHLGEEAVAFTSVHLSDHEYKKWGEIDFVVLWREGLVVIEVKGGMPSVDGRGVWRYKSRRHKPVERKESPHGQASSAYFSLVRRHLEPHLGFDLMNKAPSGFCTVFARAPRVVAHGLVSEIEMPRALIGAKEDLKDPFTLASFLGGVIEHWKARPPRSSGQWSEPELAGIARALRPMFDRVPPLSLSAARIREEQLVLTEDQYRLLDYSERMPRVLCTGGAGCGKTLIAMECLRREMPADPLLVTGTDSLAPHLRLMAPLEASRIVSFGELCNGDSRGNRAYGCLLVDEGQQLTDNASLSRLGELLKGGLENGHWRWFSDPNYQVLSNGSFDPDCQSHLEKLGAPITLKQNCRNTPQVVTAVELITGADAGAKQMAGNGPDVLFATGSSVEERIQSAAIEIRKWLEDPEIDPSEIVLLSPLRLEDSTAHAIAARASVSIKPWVPGWGQAPAKGGSMALSTIEEFRGLEAPLVVLCDMDRSVPDLRRLFYLGLTRANVALIVVADPGAVQALALEAAELRRNNTRLRNDSEV